MTVQSTRDSCGGGSAFGALLCLPRPLTALGLGLLIALAPAGGVDAQELPGMPGSATEESTPSQEPTSAEGITARRAAVSSEFQTVDAEIAKADSANAEYLSEIRERLRTIDSLLDQQAILASPEAGRVHESKPEGPDEVSPYALHALYEAQFAREQAARQLTQELAERRDALASAKERFDEAERNRRRALSELAQAEDVAREAAERTVRLRDLASRIAQEEVHLSTLEVRGAERARDVDADRAEFAERIEAIRQQLARGERQVSAGVAALAQREGELRRSVESMERLLATAELRLTTAKNRFSQQTEPSTQLLQEIEVLGARRDAIRQEIALAEAQLKRLDDQRIVWERWDALLQGRSPSDELDAWEAEANDRIDALRQAELQRKDRAADLTRRLEAIEGKLSGLAQDSRLRPALEEQRDTLRRLHAAMLAEVASLSADQRLTDRLLDDIHDETGHIDFLEYVSRGAGAVRDVWTYEITAVNDSPITVGSLVLALVFFSVGLWASRRGSGLVGRIAEDRFKLDAGAAHGLQTLSFYALLVGFTLLALRVIHFPLTAFTVLGGALAIGIGFGSQNVMNNFISGLILMLERPVRA
ncbi:MAG: mechanosensitive ion channel, partial [Myxococcales bacterium]|nr:mechanosensitive ion channel [Myxococcales bacterium]